jgi:hypothetical protein
MPSSISSSNVSCEMADPERVEERTRLDTFTIILLLTILSALALAEGVSVAKFDLTSKVQRREVAQRRGVLAVRDQAPDRPSHIALFGNSLLLDGIDTSELREKLAPGFVTTPYFVLGTEYCDWYYGLKRLFAEGMRPRYVVVGLSPNQFTSSYTRGNYSARYLFQQSDLLEVARKTHMDPTTTSGFVLAHFSEFYSTRDVTRGFLITWLLPSVAALLHNLNTIHQPPITELIVRQVGPARLASLDELCRANDSHFLLAIPPTPEGGAETIVDIGRAQGIPVLLPVASEALNYTYYQSDGFHLNEKGAKIFTARLAEQLIAQLSK